MQIAGFQPLSLIDFPGTVCSIVFTQGCPFRCVYCHNPELIPVERDGLWQPISEEHVFATLEKRKNIVEGVCITGGEPTVQADLVEFIRRVKALGLRVKLDTNGVHPQKIEELLQEQLVDFFAMDLKHVWPRYHEIIGLGHQKIVENAKKTAQILQESGVPYEFRTTVYPASHGAEDLCEIARELRDGSRYALQRMRYEKTYSSTIKQDQELDLEKIAERIRQERPGLVVEVRG